MIIDILYILLQCIALYQGFKKGYIYLIQEIILLLVLFYIFIKYDHYYIILAIFIVYMISSIFLYKLILVKNKYSEYTIISIILSLVKYIILSIFIYILLLVGQIKINSDILEKQLENSYAISLISKVYKEKDIPNQYRESISNFINTINFKKVESKVINNLK